MPKKIVKEKFKVWQVLIFGSCVTFSSLDDLLDSLKYDLKHIDEPEDITISPVFMTEDEYEKLPEFDGH